MNRGIWWVMAGGFLLLLWLSPLQGLSGLLPEPERTENRRPAPWPGAPWAMEGAGEGAGFGAWRDGMRAWFNDHFGLRKILVRGHHRAKMGLFGASPEPRVIVGREGWLFLGAHQAMDNLRTIPPMEEAELRRWEARLVAMQQPLEAAGIPFVVVMAPIKRSVYPEFLPERVARVRATSRWAQLRDWLAAHTTVPVVDLVPAVVAAKPAGRVFHMTDHHWNALGAHAAYRLLVRELARRWPGQLGTLGEPYQAEVAWRMEGGGSLARMLAMPGVFAEETPMVTLPGAPMPRRIRQAGQNGRPQPGRYVLENSARPEGPTAWVAHDSFMDPMAPMLATHFQRVVFQRGRQVNEMEVIRAKPDIVILQLSEGALNR